MKDASDIIVVKFQELFHSQPLLFTAPGRINLLGEHTDYNDGFVMPAAIDKAITFAINANDEQVFRFHALDYNEYFETQDLELPGNRPHWTRYLVGILAQFVKKGFKFPGIDCVFGGNIPIGAGLSSSAAIESGFAYGLNNLFDTGISKYQLALMAQSAEHEYAGVMCGIMDQYACMFGKKDHFLRLDCRTHKHEYLPFDPEQCVIALVDTLVKHELASSEYNRRRLECQEGVAYMRSKDPSIKALRDVSSELLETFKEGFDPIVYKRCKYVVNENARVLEACEALRDHNMARLGELMYQTHHGLRHEYEVSCNELDLLVDISRKMNYVYGSRMMGGGFGGCTINLLVKGKLDQFRMKIRDDYFRQTGNHPVIYSVNICDGVKSIIN